MYAIVRSGGKQHRVEEGRSFTVELLPAEEGAQVELNDVLLIADNGEVTIGTPTIEGARVLTLVEAHGRAKKIIVFKYKSKVRTRKKTGHRQHFTRLSVQEILRPGQEPKAAAKPKRRRKKAEEAPEETIEAAVESATVEAPEAPAPKRRTRRKAPEAAAETATPKRRTRRKAPEAEVGTAETATAEEKPKPRTRRKAPEAAAEKAKPKSRTRRKTPKAEAGSAETATAEEKPKRRRAPRRKASGETKETE